MARAGVGGLLSALAAAPILAACGGPETAGADDVLAGVPDHVDGTTRTAVVPTGTIELTVGSPVAQVPAEDSRDGTAWEAPEGSSFVPVHWEFDSSQPPLSGRLAADPQEVDVRLLVDGQERSLGSPYEVRGRALAADPVTTSYVVVPGDPSPEETKVVVEYDGAAQVVASDGTATGRGSGLADLVGRRLSTVPCGSGGWQTSSTARAEVLCEPIRTTTTPYWPGHGWAAGEAEWRVVQVPRLGVDRIRVGTAVHSVDRVIGSVAGKKLAGHTYPDSVDGTVVLEPTSTVDLELQVYGSLTRGAGPTDVELTLRRRFQLPEAPGR